MDRTFGKFIPQNNIINKLDSRLKLFALILFMVIAFMNYGNFMNSFLVLALFMIFVAIIMIISKVSFLKFLTSLKSLWFMLLLLTIINCLIPYGEYSHILHEFKSGLIIYWEAIFNAIRVSVRIFIMLALTMIFTSTTSPLDITYAFEWYLTPLRFLKFPTQVISMTMSLALRFIPTLIQEADRIMVAQKARGVDYNKGAIGKKIKSISTLIIPLLVSCFNRSDELALAMDARGYDPYAKRSRYRELKFEGKDICGLFITIFVFGVFLAISILSKNYDFLGLIFKVKGTF